MGYERIWILFTEIMIIGVLTVQTAAVIIPFICGIRTGIKYKSSFFLGTALVVLGIRYIITICDSIPVMMLKARVMNTKTAAFIAFTGYVNTILAALLDIAVIVLFCMHFVSRHKTGIRHMIVAIAANIAAFAAGIGSNYALAQFLTDRIPAPVFLFVRLLSILFLAAVYVVIIRLFLTAKEKEPVRDKLFIFPLLLMINAVVNNLLNLVSLLSRSSTGSGIMEFILILLPSFGAVVILIGSIYISRTAAKVDDGSLL